MTVPLVWVGVGFDSRPDDPVQTWTDISAYVRLSDGIELSRGRTDERDQAEPGQCSLTLDNSDGRFTWGNEASPYYPNVIPGKRIQVRVGFDAMSPYVARFDGQVPAWPVAWLNIAEVSRVQITATDRLARLGRARTLRDPVLEELGTATKLVDPPWFLGAGLEDSPPLYPSETLYPSTTLYPS